MDVSSNVFAEFAITVLLAVTASAITYFAMWQTLTRSQRLAKVSLELLERTRVFQPHVADIIFLVFFLIYVLVYSSLSLLHHQTFHTTGDVAVFDQVVWNSLHGRLFENSVELGSPSHLGVHFSPVLLALVPIYAVWSDPSSLLVFQTFVLAVAAFPLYWLSREWLGSGLAIVVAGAFFLSPALQNVNLGEFHEIPIATLLLSFAIYFLLKKRNVPFLVCLGLSLLVKEELALVTIAFGVYVFFHGKPRLGVALSLFGIFGLVLLLGIVIPHFANSENYYAADSLYSAFGKKPAEILYSLISRPNLVVSAILMPYKAEFVGYLVVPLVLLPVIGAEVSALALPTLGYLLLSDKNIYLLWRFHYTALLLPFLFFGTVLGLSRLLELAPRISAWRSDCNSRENRILGVKAAFAALLLTASTVSYYLYSQGPLARSFNPAGFSLDSGKSALGNALMRMIPGDGSVLTQEEFVPHLSQRRQVYEMPSTPDIRLLDYLFADRTRFSYNYYKPQWDRVLDSGYFEILAEQDGYFLAKRRSPEHTLEIQFGQQISLLGYTIVATDTLRGEQKLRAILEWRVDQPITQEYHVNVSLVDKRGHIWAKEIRELLDGVPLDQINLWRVGKSVSDEYTLALPSTMPPGDYQISVDLYDPGPERNLVAIEAGQPEGEQISFGSLRIEKDKSSITASQLRERFELEQPYYVDMGEIRLLGFKPIPQSVVVGNVLPIGLYWRARAKPRGDYAVAVQLLDSSGHVVLEQKDRPAAGTYPTTQWDEGEVLLDWHDLVVPTSVSPSEYTLQVVLSDVASGAKLGEATVSSLSVVER